MSLLAVLFLLAVILFVVLMCRERIYLWAQLLKHKLTKLLSRAKSPSSKLKLIVYDFDQTLTCEHVFFALDGARVGRLESVNDDDFLNFFGSRERLGRLSAHLKFIRKKRIAIKICSNGWEDVIMGCFERLARLGYFEAGLIDKEDIVGRELLGRVYGKKNGAIRHWMKELSCEPDQALFVDDDISNIGSVQAGMVCLTYHVNSHGLTSTDFENIEALT